MKKNVLNKLAMAIFVISLSFTSSGALASRDTTQADQLGFNEIVFIKRKPLSSDHSYTDIDNGTKADRFDADNGIFIYNLKTKKQRPVITAANMPGGKGFISKISLSFDAKKVAFDFRENVHSGFRVWEVHLDGTGLRQISKAPADEVEKVKRLGKKFHTDDIHPAYLPDGKIVFSSTRCEQTVLCGASASKVSPVLHRMNADGTNTQQISFGLLNEFCPLVLDDGRILYHRWEYIDKGSRVCKTFWTMNPDGSNIQEFYGLRDDNATAYMYPQMIPGTNKIVCSGSPHYPQGGNLGPIIIINPDKGSPTAGPDPDEKGFVKLSEKYSVANITPSVFVDRRKQNGWQFLKDGKYITDQDGTSGHLYTHPFPVSERQFLVSYKVRSTDHYQNVPDAYALYLIDIDGNHTAILKDDKLSCWHPIPVVARKRPPVIHSFTKDPTTLASKEAVCVISNIYEGMKNVERGEIKWLRVNEAVPRYWSTSKKWKPGWSSSAWKAAIWPRVQWGIVPVEKDGSANFKVPADRSLFFQALDKDFREIQRERTVVNYQAGQVRACVGCHGKSNNAPGMSGVRAGSYASALIRQPSELAIQPCDLVKNGGNGNPQQVIHYPTDIQPIFDAKCISCHGNEKPEGNLTLTGDMNGIYTNSYKQLATKELAGPIIPEFTSFKKGDQGNYNGKEFPAKSLGSHQSVMIDLLAKPKHAKNKKSNHTNMLTEMELMRLTRWVDSNYQFYGSFYGRQHPMWKDADPKNPDYNPKNFRRRATFEETISNRAPKWHK
jgi:hypothetical protein